MDEPQSQRQDQAPAMQAAVRDEGRQFALPLVVRVERADPPTRTDALEGAARAVLEFLSDPRVTEPDGEWAAAARAWEDAGSRTGRGAGAVAESGAADVDRESHGPGRPRCAASVVGAGTNGPFEMERC